ncbi:MAG TPA: anti-sigma factor [Gemmatimonadaceae bacterium]|nr:anti-sigma factor [Gemmatimonadaceae bacterium]
MTHEQFEDLLSAYADGELDDVASLEAHLPTCAPCTARLAEYRGMGDALRRQAHAETAPLALRQRIAATLEAAEATAASPWARRRRPMWSPGVLAAAAAVVLAVGLAVGGRRGGGDEAGTTAQEVLDSHVRSLAGDQAHLFDVASTDQHTVKPWFSGKLDFAPSVVDLAPQGFPLLGGRVDFISGKRVAALVYGRRQHKINVYEWPGGNESKPAGELRLGYSMLHWTHAGMVYWAVSDVNPTDLQELARNIDTISR